MNRAASPVRTASRRLSRPAPSKGIQINVNTIIGAIVTILAGVIVWMVTHGLEAAKENSKSLTTITTTLPYMQKTIDGVVMDVKEVNKDLKEAKSTMVTRNELENKNARLQDAIKDVRGDVKEVKDEQVKVRDDLQRLPAKPK